MNHRFHIHQTTSKIFC